ncbi:MAG: divergent polysaccharide deacetylase family protein [Rhodospirillales bacterium]|nr:divergent polysaccharide deacetylase family protein [Rhodospirillales bacterium]
MKFKPNPARQAILIGLALAGIGIGYGMGFLLKSEPTPPLPTAGEPASTRSDPVKPQAAAESPAATRRVARPVLPESHGNDDNARAYEEALPEEIVHFPALTVPPLLNLQNQPPVATTAPPQVAAAPFEPIPAGDYSEPATAAPEPVVNGAGAPELEEDQTAALVEPEQQPAPPLGPAGGWLKNALAVVLTDKPKIAIVIDDMGVDRRRSRIAAELPGPLTLSYLTYADDLAEQTGKARQAGHELMLHVPMEPSSKDIDPGPNVLLSGVPATKIRAALDWGLSQFSGYVGVNNHMGSKFTSDLEGMKVLMQELRQRKMIFLDSVTSGSTKGQLAAHQIGVPFIARNIFLDHIDNIDDIHSRLREVKRLATRQGYAVAIGHPRDATLEALTSWLHTIESEGFQLVPISALIRQVSMADTALEPSTTAEATSK